MNGTGDRPGRVSQESEGHDVELSDKPLEPVGCYTRGWERDQQMVSERSETGATPGGEVRLSFTVPASVLSALRRDPDGFAHELRVAAAVKWYERRLVSQGRAAEIAGVSRADFLLALDRYEVSPFQCSSDELVEEATR